MTSAVRSRPGDGVLPGIATHAAGGLAWAGFLAVLLFLYAPLITIAVFAFNDSTTQTLPWAGFTTRWFTGLPEDRALLGAMRFGLLVSGITVLVSAVLGTLFAVTLHTVRGRAGRLLEGALVLPVVVPGLVLGLSLAITFRYLGLQPGLPTVVLGHVSFTAPIVTLLVLARLGRLDPALVQASMDLGADPWRTFRHVTWPQIRTAVLAASLLVLTLSFDEVIVTFFLVGTQPTLPVHIWSQTRFGFTPAINAVVTLIGFVSVLLIVVATRILQRSIDAQPTSVGSADTTSREAS